MNCGNCGLPLKNCSKYGDDYIHLVSPTARHEYYGCELATGNSKFKGMFARLKSEPTEEPKVKMRKTKTKSVLTPDKILTELKDRSIFDLVAFYNEHNTWLEYSPVMPYCIKVKVTPKKILFANSEKELKTKFWKFIKEEKNGE